jgi:transportin-3
MVLKLRVTLIAHVKRHKNSSRQVREKLCQATAQLAIQDMSWKNVCADLTPKFGRDDMESLLRIFKLLPEECHNKKSTAHVESQRQRAKEFDNCAGDVLGLLTQCMNMARGNLNLVKGVLQCQRSWLQYSNIPTRVMASSPLLVMPFDALNSRELFEDALKTILATVKMYWDSSRHLDVVKIILPRVLQLEPRYKRAVQSKNVDAARDFIRIFVETGEAYVVFEREAREHRFYHL